MLTNLHNDVTRRRFLRDSAVITTGLVGAPTFATAAERDVFSFVLLGDLHLDKLSHHDLDWLAEHKAGDLSQIANYSRITAEITPKLFAAVRESVVESQATLVVQVGDLVEGLCGTEELAVTQNAEALAFVHDAKLGVPFVFTKGNHDVTGDGATEAFQHVFHPFLSEQTSGFKRAGRITTANYSVEHANSLFCFFDAYNPLSLDWLEAALVERSAQHCFVVIHPPVVPYGARSTWHLFAKSRDKAKREMLLNLLGKHHAIVLGGHIHKFNTLTRLTPSGGRFVQLALSSVVGTDEVTPRNQLSGTDEYNANQVRVEPTFSPETEPERRAVYAEESPFVTTFEYADLPGHAVVTVDGDQVTAQMFSGVSRKVWRTVNLSSIMQG